MERIHLHYGPDIDGAVVAAHTERSNLPNTNDPTMIIRSSLILALALPAIAQDGVQDKAGVSVFYKAFYLDKGETDNKKSAAKAIERAIAQTGTAGG